MCSECVYPWSFAHTCSHTLCAVHSDVLLAFQVDPDMIRARLPEYEEYVSRDVLTAGHLTQKEAGLVQELLTLEGLRRGKNVLVDASLRNAKWNKVFFQRIRQVVFPSHILSSK